MPFGTHRFQGGLAGLQRLILQNLAGKLGIEPKSALSESAVLPLDDFPT